MLCRNEKRGVGGDEGGRDLWPRRNKGPPHQLVNWACQVAITAKHRGNSFYLHRNLSLSIYSRANVYLPDLLYVSTYTRSLRYNTDDVSYYSSRNWRLYMHNDLNLLYKLRCGIVTCSRSTIQKTLRYTLPNIFHSTGSCMPIQGLVTC